MRYHVYQLSQDGPAPEEIESEELAAANNYLLPCLEFKDFWENLVFDAEIKRKVSQKLAK